MPLRALTTWSVVDVAFYKPHDYIWICDALLNTSLRRFCGTRTQPCKRHGSSVPGPLEAKRRLAKRRMNNLSVGRELNLELPPPGLASADIYDLFDVVRGRKKEKKKMEWKWEPPNYARKEENEVLHEFFVPLKSMPPWLSSDPIYVSNSHLEVESFSLPPRSPEPPLDMQSIPELSTVPRLKIKEYYFRLQDVHGLNDLKALHAKIDVDPRDEQIRSRLDFYRLMNQGRPLKELASFLRDPKLNLAYDEDIKMLFTFHMKNPLQPMQFPQIMSLLKRGIKRGSLSSSYIIRILGKLPTVIEKAYGAPKEVLLYRAYRSIWHAVSNSAPTPLESRQPWFFRAFLHAVIRNVQPSSQAQALAADILCLGSPLHRTSFEEYNMETLMAQFACFIVHQQALSNIEYNAPTELVHLLKVLPYKFVQQWVTSTTEIFADPIRMPRRGVDTRARLLLPWLAAIEMSKFLGKPHHDRTWAIIYKTILPILRLKDLAPHFASMRAADAANIILRYCYTLEPRYKRRASGCGKRNSTSVSDCSLSIPQWPSVDAINATVAEMATLNRRLAARLPSRQVALGGLILSLIRNKHTHPRSFDDIIRLFWAMGGRYSIPEVIEVILTRLPHCISPSVVGPIIQHLLKQDPSCALRIFQLDRRLWLSRLSGLPIALIGRSRLDADSVLALLGRYDPAACVPVRRRTRRARRSGCTLSNSRILMVHAMARECARETLVSASEAQRYVMWCYRYLKRAKAPIYKGMGRAMLVACVLRPFRESQAVMDEKMFKWVTSIVRRLEGRDAVKRLEKSVARRPRFFGVRYTYDE